MQIMVVGVGYTGRRLMQACPDARGISRRRLPEITPGRQRLLDLDESPLASIATGDNVALLYTVPPAPAGETDTRLANFLGAIETAPKRLVYLSTTGVYGDRHGLLTDETVPPAPALPRTMRRWDAEKSIFNYCATHGCQPFVLRVPGIYGPQRTGIARLQSGDAYLREEDSNPGNRIHVDDLVSCCIAALTGDAPPGVYNVGDGDHTSSTGMARIIARLAGLPEPKEISRDAASKAFSAERLSYLQESRLVDTRKMRELLCVTPRYAVLGEGLRASLAEEGWLQSAQQ